MTLVKTISVTADEADLRLDRWFKRHFPDIGHGMLEKLLRTGQIRVDGKRAKSNQRLVAGQDIRVPPLPTESDPAKAPAMPAAKPKVVISAADEKMLRDAVLFMDDDVIALNKPPGLAVQGGTGMGDKHLDALLDALTFDKPERPRLVHRLDKDTSGVLLLGRSAGAASKLTAAFKSRAARKCYWALVVKVPKLPMGRISAPLAKMEGWGGEKVVVDEDDGKHAVTYYRIVDHALRSTAWLEMEPRTGRTHQLRAHCLLLGTPILGDGKYGGQEAFLAGQGVSRKLHLHARALRIPHPRGKGILEITAPLPSHMAGSFEFFDFSESQAGKPFESFDEE